MVFIDQVQLPPLDRFGLPEFSTHQQTAYDGIIYNDTYFLRKEAKSESLHFHELVHVIQWQRLGVERFLLAYGIGLAQFGYENSALEKMRLRSTTRIRPRDLPQTIGARYREPDRCHLDCCCRDSSIESTYC